MRLNTAARTDAGRERDTNEDAVLSTPLEAIEGWLLAVADGMGGHQAGSVASETAIETLRDRVSDEIGPGRDVPTVLDTCIEAANIEIRSRAAADPARAGMGTTLVTAVVTDEGVTIANVGDSRAYLVDDEITQVTTDQTLVRELAEQGAVSDDEVADHPQRHVLSQALGTTDDIAPEVSEVGLAGRTLVLCSDGLTEEVAEETIRKIVTSDAELSAVADQLIRQAYENGGSDNSSVVLAHKP